MAYTLTGVRGNDDDDIILDIDFSTNCAIINGFLKS